MANDDTDPNRQGRTTRWMATTDRKYIKFKMKKIKEAKKSGNNALAERHAEELYQYLGWSE